MLTSAEILSSHAVTPRLFVLTLEWKGSIQPGQFFMLHTPSDAQILPRPLSIFDYDPVYGRLSFLIGANGHGTEAIQRMIAGQTVSLFGPLGRGFPTDMKGQNILMVGGREGLAPFLFAAKELKYHNHIRIFAGFKDAGEAEILKYFAAYEDEIAIYHTVEEQGALVTGLFRQVTQPQTVFLCGSAPMMKACLKEMSEWKSTKKYVSLDARMACGVGACMGCTVKGKKAPLRPCSEGPVFEAKEVF